MLRKQHKGDDSHNDMPLIYYIEGHSLHFGRPEFALITGLRFGTISFSLYTSGELKFRNKVFSHKLGLIVTNLDVIGVIEDEEMFRKLCDEDSIRLCLLIALEVIFMGRLLTCPVDDALFQLDENLEAWNVLAHERNDKLGRLQFNDDFFRMSSDFQESLNIVFQDLIDPHDSDEDIANDYLVEEELRLCLEDEERMRLEQETIIKLEKSFRLEEAKRMRLEEEKMLQIAEVNKRKRHEFMNSTHVKKILAKLTPSERNDVHYVTGKTKLKESWVKIKKYRQNVNDPSLAELLKKLNHGLRMFHDFSLNGHKGNFWLRLVCLDPGQKGWLSEEHIDLWVGYMWHGRPENANWAMVFIPINETTQHWCLAHLDILSRLVTFYDSEDTYDYEWRDWLFAVDGWDGTERGCQGWCLGEIIIMGEPLSPDRVFDFPIDEPHPAYDFFAPALLPEYVSNPNNNNGWLEVDDYLLGELEAMVDEQMVVLAVDEIAEQMVVPAVEEMDAPMMDMEEDLAVLFGDDDFEDDASDGFGEEEVWEVNEDWLMAPTTPPLVLAVPPPSIYEVGGPSTAVAKGPSLSQVAPGLPVPPSVIEDLSTHLDNLEYGHGQLVKRVIQGNDAEIAASVTIGEIGPRVLAMEGQMQVMASQMIHAMDRVEQVGFRCAVERYADPAAADYCYRDEQQGEHADAVHFRIRETDCSLREKTTRTLVVLNGEEFSYRRRMLPLTYQPMAEEKTSFLEIECGGSIDISIPDAVKDQGEALSDA
ncbi:phospholipase-like protein [Tanacetum coccineum]